MHRWLRLSLIIAAITLLPIIPFVLLGGSFESAVESWLSDRTGAFWLAAGSIGLLASDIFLPIPSSVVCTLAGSRLGWFRGGLVCWMGLNLGSLAGYGLAYQFGSPMARRWSRPEDLAQAEALAARWGSFTLVLTRGLPILGEAMVLVMGVYRLSWWRFCLPVAASNLGLSLAYTALGDWASEAGWLPIAIGIAAALPLVPLLGFRQAAKLAGGSPIDTSDDVTDE